MITADGWLDWAQRVPGPMEKRYTQTNTCEWYLPHSAVGYYPGWEQRLFNMERGQDGKFTSYAAASVHGWIAYDGTVKQHYPMGVSCWASGSLEPNTRGVAFENEGGAPGQEQEPLTPAQVLANLHILQELAEWKGRDPTTYWRRPTSLQDKTATLYEHRECVRFGSSPTACPSNRIPWEVLLTMLKDEPTPEVPGQPTLLGYTAGEIAWAAEHLSSYALAELVYPDNVSLPRLDKMHPYHLQILKDLVAESERRTS